MTGRKKDLIITAYGKNIQPEGIADPAARHEPLISHAVVIGDDRPYLTALLTIDTEAAAEWASHAGCSHDPAVLVDDPGFRAEIERAVERVNEDHANAERIKRWHLLPQDFTLAGGELTPTLKVKRNVIVERYTEVIEELYAAS